MPERPRDRVALSIYWLSDTLQTLTTLELVSIQLTDKAYRIPSTAPVYGDILANCSHSIVDEVWLAGVETFGYTNLILDGQGFCRVQVIQRYLYDVPPRVEVSNSEVATFARVDHFIPSRGSLLNSAGVEQIGMLRVEEFDV